MLTDDDWKDEEKESTVLIILFPTCCHSLLPDFFAKVLMGQAKLLKKV
jgi:hypothetical protein